MGDYRQMWADLGLDLEAHDALLGALGSLYEEHFTSRGGRPKAMEYFDFVMSEVHGLRIQELVDARKEGRVVVGTFCVFVPEELVLAVDGICVGLCAGADFAPELAERYLPRTTCPLIKSFFGFALARVCPYLAACDLVVGENTCDGKKKAYEVFERFVPGRFMVLDVPNTKGDLGRLVLRQAYRDFLGVLEEQSGRKVTADGLRRAIEVVNAKRRALARLARLRKGRPAVLSGLDGLLVNQVSFYDDPVRFTSKVEELCDELEGRTREGVGVAPSDAPRVVFSGCPMAVPNWKLPALVESCGGVVVGEESCIGERGLRGEVDTEPETVEGLLDALVDRYFQIDCAIFTPNPDRVEHVLELAREAEAGVIHYALQFCGPYEIESLSVEEKLREAGVPVLRLSTDYGSEDRERLRVRVEAFLETLRS